MARRRVFHTKVECPGITDLALTANRSAIIGRAVMFEKSALDSTVAVLLDGVVVGHLDDIAGPQVALAIDRGQSFTAVIENAYQNYDKRFKPVSGLIYLKAEYLLEKDRPAIEIPKAQVEIHEHASRSFFTKIAGVSHEGRQRVVARCSVGENLLLVRDPNNRFDSGAIKVMRLSGEQLGFIPEHVSRSGDLSGLACRMDRGQKYRCRISDLTGHGRETLGVNIEITEGEPDGVLAEARTSAQTMGSDSESYRLRLAGRQVDKENSAIGWAVLILLVTALLLAARGCGPR